MTTISAKIDELTAALPADVRARVEEDLVDAAEYAVALHEERELRIATAQVGLAELERGDLLTVEEFRAEMADHVTDLRAKHPAA